MDQPSYSEYHHYEVEDFVADEAFQQWASQPDTESDRLWEQFLQIYPEKREAVEEARDIITNIRYQPYTLSRERQQHILQQVYEKAEKVSSNRSPIHRPFYRKYAAVAAVGALLLATVAVWQLFPRFETYQTAYQENKTIVLTDGSEVALNANTTLKVKVDTDNNAPREVWLEGEAYFHVKRLSKEEADQFPKLKTFIVHTDNLDIEVLGTTFNVTSRPTHSEVLLKSGKVKVASPQIEQTQILQPGDLLSLSEEDNKFQLIKTEADTTLNWRNNLFIFEQTTLREVARAIEEYYGFEVKIATQTLASKTFTAKISRDELPLLLEAIEVSFEVKVKQEGKIIRIYP